MSRRGRIAWGGFVAVTLAGVLPPVRAQIVSPAAVPAAGRIAVIHARAYLTPGEDPIDDATILIEDGKVRTSGAGLAVPAGFRVIDAKGDIVTPGLMNSNSRMALTETEGDENTDSGVSSGPFGEAFDPAAALNANSTVLPSVRADGLTRAAVLPTGSAAPPFSGEALLLVLREGPDILEQPRAAVVVHVGGMLVNSSGGSRAAQWLLLRDALDAASHNSKPGTSVAPAGFSGVTPENLAGLKPVLDGKIPLVVEASRESDLRQAIALVDDYKIHVVLLGAEEGWRVAPLLTSHHIAVVV